MVPAPPVSSRSSSASAVSSRNSTTSSADSSSLRNRSAMAAATACADAAISSSRRSKIAWTTGSPSRSAVMSMCCRSICLYDTIGQPAPRRDGRHLPAICDKSRQNLHRALEAGSERLLQLHVQEPKRLQLARTGDSARVDRVEAPVARERRHALLGALVIARDQNVERLAGHLAVSQRGREVDVEGLH